jgi:hypothetical protein
MTHERHPRSSEDAAPEIDDEIKRSIEPGKTASPCAASAPGPRVALGLVRELRGRDRIDANVAVTVVARHALGCRLAAAEAQ